MKICSLYTDTNRFDLHPNHENDLSTMDPRLRASLEAWQAGNFLNFKYRSAAQDALFWGRQHSSCQMYMVVTIPASYLNATVFKENDQ
jgi:hypothetical protein